MARYRMGKLEIEGAVFTCSRGTLWPPMQVVAYGPTAEDARPHVEPAEYERIRVWEGACGLFEMEAQKCLSCPYVECNGSLVTPAGGGGYKPPSTKAVSTVKTRLPAARPGLGGKKR